MKKITKKILLVDIISILTAGILLAVSWNSNSFSNWYRVHIFPIWVNTLGRVSGIFPFSVGEILLYLAVVLVAIWLFTAIFFICTKGYKSTDSDDKRNRIQKFFRNYSLILSLIISLTTLEMVLNCFILYHTDSFTNIYAIDGIGAGPNTEFGDYYNQYWANEGSKINGEIDAVEAPELDSSIKLELDPEQKDLITLRNWMVKNALELSDLMERDENGYVLYNKDEKKQAIVEMKRLGENYPILAGFYPKAKLFWYSEFFSQQNIMGYFFPFTMEVNINRIMYYVNRPTTICHELSHLKGFILEDEANFIGYLACIDSEDPFFRYSAYTAVLSYVEKDYRKLKKVLPEKYFEDEEKITKRLAGDTIFLTDEAWAQVEAKKIFSTELVEKASDAFIDGNLKANGVSDGAISYSRVVRLLLRYYQVSSQNET